VTWIMGLALAATIGLSVYLVVALFHPEKFL
jgi:K+-transporting ATPase KdpF subunit